MRLKAICFLLLAFSSGLSYGQDRYLGLRLGINNASASPSSLLETHTFKTGFAGGFSFEQFYKDKISFGADLIYTQRGFALQSAQFIFDPVTGFNQGTDEYLIKFHHDYLSVPLYARIYFGDNFFGFCGLSVSPSILLRYKNDYLNDSAIRETSRPNLFEFGGQIELGCGYKIKPDWHLVFSIHYYHGITKVNNDSYFATTDFRNASTNVSIGLKYRLARK